MKTCPRCHKQRPDDEVAHTCVVVTRLDHEAAKSRCLAGLKELDGFNGVTRTYAPSLLNAYRAYLDAMAQLEAVQAKLVFIAKYVRCPDGEFSFPDGDSIECQRGPSFADVESLAMTLKARLDKATELLREYAGVKRAGVGVGLLAKTRLFLNERK